MIKIEELIGKVVKIPGRPELIEVIDYNETTGDVGAKCDQFEGSMGATRAFPITTFRNAVIVE